MGLGTKGCWRVERAPGVDPVEIGLARQQALADEITGQASTPLLLVWRSRPALLVSRSETRLPRFEIACTRMQAAGWPVLPRKTGGEACPVAPGTVQASIIEAASPDVTMNAEYAVLAELIQAMLRSFQIPSRIGLVTGSYCPGLHDVAVEGRKIAGMSQNWFRNRCGVHCVIAAASVNIEEPPDGLAGAVNQFYCSAGSTARCRAAALTNMRLCGGTALLAERDLAAAVMNRLAVLTQINTRLRSHADIINF